MCFRFPHVLVKVLQMNVCLSHADDCTDGQVRLVDGATDVEGRVEICFSRKWGTISGDGWTQTESTIVCNDLGYEATGKVVANNQVLWANPPLKNFTHSLTHIMQARTIQ